MATAPRAVPVPQDSRIAGLYPSTHLADAFSIELPRYALLDAPTLTRFIFEGAKPSWLVGLLWLRDRLVSPWGVKSSASLRASEGDRIDFFRVYYRGPSEVVLGEDDWHLDFRASILIQPSGYGAGEELVMSTLVRCHNGFGRLYILAIAPFHRLVVRSALRRAARRGWPSRGMEDDRST